MPAPHNPQRKLTWFAAILGGLVLVLIVALALFDWNLLRPSLARLITEKTGRPAAIDGDLKVHVFSWTPSAEVNGLSLKNPSWADRDIMFAARRLTVSVSLARLLRGQIVIPEIELDEPVINLERDAKGRASWELGTSSGTPSGDTKPSRIPAIRRLTIREGKLHVVDLLRKLRFGGSLIASDEAGGRNESAFKISAKGTLNEKPFTLEVHGGPLLDLSPDTPYSFASTITASDINLVTHVTVQKPFDLSDLNVKFELSGNDLADVFYLTGLALPNTPHYRLSATVKVAGTTYQVDDLKGQLGGSDIAGKGEVVNRKPRPKLTAALTSHNVRFADLALTLGRSGGEPASLSADEPKAAKTPQGRAPQRAAQAPPPKPGLLLPDADLQANRVRGMDADVTYAASTVTAPKLPMKTLNFHLVLDDGLLTIDPLSFVLDQGQFSGSVRIDARHAVQESDIDMHINDLDLTQFKTAAMKEPPLTGLLLGRIKLHGTGTSVHKFAATADGAVSMVIPKGGMNSAIAELTGINVLQGLGLLLTKDETKTDIRCSVIDFQAAAGNVAAKNVFVDTSNVLITGKGGVNLASEKLDLEIKGDPKKVRLTRLRSPITVTGTLAQPSVGLDAGKLAAQGAVAAALGVLLTPAASVLAFIDPGLAKNKDCAASVQDEKAPIEQ